jgi:hypothetical protein
MRLTSGEPLKSYEDHLYTEKKVSKESFEVS